MQWCVLCVLLDGEWTAWVTTGTEDLMNTTGTVTLYAYGSKATSGPIVLGKIGRAHV